MARVLLVSSNVSRSPYPVYPIGLAMVAAGLVRAGHKVECFDFLASGESEHLLRRTIAAGAPDYVCLSIRNLDNCDAVCPEGYSNIPKRLVEVIRGATRAPVIAGGAAFSILPEELRAFLGVDYGAVGEGERLLPDLLADLEAGRPVPPLHRSRTFLAGDEIPAPLFSQELVDFYLRQSGMVSLQTKRGCAYRCAHCPCPGLDGGQVRAREPQAVVDDLEKAKTEFGADSFFFTDPIFNDPGGQYLSVAEEIVRRGLSIRWCCYMRPAGIGRTEVALLKRAGLYAVELGTDAGCDTTLQALGKGFSFADVVRAHDAFVAERLPCAHFVMFGGPGETPGTVAEGLANLDRLAHCVMFAYSGIRILPNTALHARAMSEGLIAPGAPLLEPVYYVSPLVDAAAMNHAVESAWRGRRDRIFPPDEGLKRLKLMYSFGYRGLVWNRLIRFPGNVASSTAT